MELPQTVVGYFNFDNSGTNGFLTATFTTATAVKRLHQWHCRGLLVWLSLDADVGNVWFPDSGLAIKLKDHKTKPLNMNSNQILDREFLQIRAKILEIAASLDRLERADGDCSDDARMKLLRQGIELLASVDQKDQASSIQMLFSRDYSQAWRDEFGV